ncbi:MAG: hypothetical protein J6S92_13355, partial [Oscillospiraceae bacterium]|nr:hypothetical protein [Oscillospiraceae bacterium]
MSDIRLGRQTPTVSRVLPYTDSRGTEAVEQYNQSGRTAQEWQERMVEDIMATNEQGLWVHMKFGWAVPRRNGKSEILIMRAIWGLINGERVLYTAHRATTSSSAWEKVCKLLGKMGFAEEEDYKPYRTRGLEQILWLHGEGVINFRTRTSTGGLGEGYDLLIIDEAQEYTGDQESALKYVVTDSKNRAAVYSGAYIGMLAEETLLASGTGDYAVTVFREGQQGQYSNFAGLLNLNSKTLSIIRYLTAADKYDKMHEVTAETARGSSMTVNPELHYLNHTLQSPYLKTAYSFKNGTLSATTGQDVNAVFTIPMENYFNIVQEYNQSEYDGYFDLKIPYDIQVTDMNGTGNQTAFYKTYTVRKHAMKSSGQKTILTDQVEHTVGASSAG